MTDERADAGPKTASPKNARPDRAWRTAYKIMSAPGYPSGGILTTLTPEELALVAAASIYSKAFLEALAKRHADGFSELVNKRFRKNGKNTEAEIGLDGDAAAKIVVTADTPDEARIALLDLDVTADELRGKLLRWDSTASAWCPADDQ